MVDLSAFLAGAGFKTKLTFTVSGSFIVPNSVKTLMVILTGGGAGGWGGSGSGATGNARGGGAGATTSAILNVQAGDELIYIIGAGSAGVAGATGGPTIAPATAGSSAVFLNSNEKPILLANGGRASTSWSTGASLGGLPLAAANGNPVFLQGGDVLTGGSAGLPKLLSNGGGFADYTTTLISAGALVAANGSGTYGGVAGGSSYYGKGADGGDENLSGTGQDGDDATNYGAGGGGGGRSSTATAGGTGGDGANGFIEIWY